MSKTLFFRNLKPSDIPPIESKEYNAFLLEEREKCLSGFYAVSPSGVRVYYNGLLYFLTQHFKISQDILDDEGNFEGVKVCEMDATDNLWIATEAITQAEKNSEGVCIFGIRRGSKSTLESGYIARNASLIINSVNVVAGASTTDLENINTYLEFGLDNIWDGFKHSRVSNEWTKGVSLGVKSVTNVNDYFSFVKVRNFQEGKKTQILAGLTPTSLILDEIGKSDFLKALTAGYPALRSRSGKFRCPIIAVGTGGEAGKTADAKKLAYHPEVYSFKSFDIIGENKKGCLFIPRKYRFDAKYEGNLYQVLEAESRIPREIIDFDVNIETFIKEENRQARKEKSRYKRIFNHLVDFNKIKVFISDEEKAELLTKQEVESYRNAGEEELALQTESYYPTKLAQCFEKLTDNPYAYIKNELEAHRDYLLENYHKIATYVDVFYDTSGTPHFKMSNKKPILTFPHSPSDDLDAPVCMYEPPKYKGHYYLHVAGLDSYHVDGKSMTSKSLGSCYVMRRNPSVKDPFACTMVASYTARPNDITFFFTTVRALIDLYDASLLHEYTNISIIQDFKHNHKTHLLLDVENLSKLLKTNSTVTQTLGVAPTPANRNWGRTQESIYLNEKIPIGIDETTGEVKFVKGLVRILDPMYITECLNYEEGGNYDRIDSFRWTCAAKNYCDENYKEIEIKEAVKVHVEKSKNENLKAFGYTKNSTFLKGTSKKRL